MVGNKEAVYLSISTCSNELFVSSILTTSMPAMNLCRIVTTDRSNNNVSEYHVGVRVQPPSNMQSISIAFCMNKLYFKQCFNTLMQYFSQDF